MQHEIGVIAKVFSDVIYERIRKNDITIQNMREKTGWGREKCENELAKKVAAGLLVTDIALNKNNQKTTVWREPVDTKP